MNVYERSLQLHAKLRGKFEVRSLVEVKDRESLSLAYTPGVAQPCKEIAADPSAAYLYTRKWNTVAVVSDGSAVLGLGNIGGLAGLPVMEGKAVLFREFGGIDAIPIVLSGQDTDDIVKAVEMIAPSFGGINLEDIRAPKCFEVERRLKEKLDIPVFHDDQHGTAIVTSAALFNALKLADKKLEEVRIVICGAGSAGIAICKLLQESGAKHIVLTASRGIVCKGEPWLSPAQKEIAEVTNEAGLRGKLEDAVRGADVFIGVSAPNQLSKEMVRSMAPRAVVFAMANPEPEIYPQDALDAGAFVVGTGRSDFPNQINNVLAFPGVFRGALDVRAKDISEGMKVAAARALANLVGDDLSPEYVIPSAFDGRVASAVAAAVADAARREGLARV
ncbi:MAG TPA: NADP-dependent malic enzyme [Candidatus Borkfalkia faecigallinarum]|uniref:NADP-dependent malic enzyme n=1 Tax=Candidatus Borkfalkia faecigallinarum TaxID=2838509 RepID=A0A9D1VUM7_9FIRM|nr:NADP-dependent malic enzyme [Candidatus Borkfalkia faecigallinarum]